MKRVMSANCKDKEAGWLEHHEILPLHGDVLFS